MFGRWYNRCVVCAHDPSADLDDNIKFELLVQIVPSMEIVRLRGTTLDNTVDSVFERLLRFHLFDFDDTLKRRPRDKAKRVRKSICYVVSDADRTHARAHFVLVYRGQRMVRLRLVFSLCFILSFICICVFVCRSCLIR